MLRCSRQIWFSVARSNPPFSVSLIQAEGLSELFVGLHPPPDNRFAHYSPGQHQPSCLFSIQRHLRPRSCGTIPLPTRHGAFPLATNLSFYGCKNSPLLFIEKRLQQLKAPLNMQVSMQIYNMDTYNDHVIS